MGSVKIIKIVVLENFFQKVRLNNMDVHNFLYTE